MCSLKQNDNTGILLMSEIAPRNNGFDDILFRHHYCLLICRILDNWNNEIG